MNKLTNPLQAMIDAASKQVASKKVTQAVTRHQARATQGSSSNAYFVLADISGSMNERAGSQSKIDLLRTALKDPAIDWTIQQLIAFHSFPQPIAAPGDLPDPTGSTALHLALDYVQPQQPARTLLISDGHPDSEELAMAAADKLSGKIDVLYIGPDNDHRAIRFMYQLAGRTGGSVTVNDVRKNHRQLPAQIKQLLLN